VAEEQDPDEDEDDGPGAAGQRRDAQRHENKK
jgi:hypothetical protein